MADDGSRCPVCGASYGFLEALTAPAMCRACWKAGKQVPAAAPTPERPEGKTREQWLDPEFFSIEGRYNRARYFWAMLVIALLADHIIVRVGFLVGLYGGEPAVAGGIGAIIGVCAAIIGAFPALKRLHDLNRPGTHYLLLFIPIYNLYFGLVLLFRKGTEGRNEYGPDPLNQHP